MSFFCKLIPPVCFLLIWQMASQLRLAPSWLLPSPEQTWQAFFKTLETGELASAVSASLRRAAEGFAISACAGCAAAGAMARFPVLDKLLDPTLNFIRMTPPLALIPLLILWLGIGEATQLAVIILAAFFPVLLNARAGFAKIDDSLKELSASLGLSKKDFALYFAFPAAFPSIITGLRLSFGYSWRALIAAELIAASSGLGQMILEAEQMQRVDVAIVGIFCIGVIGWLADSIFRLAISRFFQFRFPELKTP